MTNKTGLCIQCGEPLSGKQRNYCSDKCRKRKARNADNPDKKTLDNPETHSPLAFFARLADAVSDLDEGGKLELMRNLSAIAEYQQIWTKRVLAQPNFYPPKALDTYQRTESIFRIVTDYVQEIQI
jgi:hypothetical protein